VSGRTIVLVEDDPGDALLVREMLSDVAQDVDLLVFPSMHRALEGWPVQCDCVLLDLGLPDAFGLAALDKLRDHAPDVPVVVLTGRSDVGAGPEALAAGAQDFLVKGEVSAAGLERSLRYAVERGRARNNERELLAAEVRAEENTRLERGLLPSPLIGSDLVRVGSFYRPGRERALLGGDFYDVVETPDGVHALIGDVSGHGPDEAALGVALRIAWRSLVLAGHAPEEVLRGVERVLLAERDDDERYATVAVVTTDPRLERADVVLCGHPAPLLVSGGRVSAMSAAGNPPLTMLGNGPLERTSVDLPGDWALLLFTDGLVEGSSEPGSAERWGADALGAHLELLLREGCAPTDVAPRLLAAAEGQHGGPLTDDVAVLVVARADGA
jgi:serine phosphatase RsbU (regulator of sigma subunit)